ncbi:MAG TPA: hypothetical protein VGP21_02265, partial [Opitutaceae bacterium]|nr:hypothetical protein [Opitutaceae bacterium]
AVGHGCGVFVSDATRLVNVALQPQTNVFKPRMNTDARGYGIFCFPVGFFKKNYLRSSAFIRG